ncbi:MAG: hypothetical protein ACE5GS_04615 [Kiloniellaceae bacterium]
MSNTMHVPNRFGTARSFEASVSRAPEGRTWPVRAAILFWLAASAAVWAALVGSAAIFV